MSKPQIGDRVGAIQSADETTAHMFGYGVYDGDFEISIEIGDEALKTSTPRIKLDNGKVVYGAECWWGSEDAVKARVEGLTIINVDPTYNPEENREG